MAVSSPIPSNNPAGRPPQAARLGPRASRLLAPVSSWRGGTPAVPGRPRSLSFRRVKLRRLALIAVRHVLFRIVFRRTEKFGELAEINVDHRRRVEGQKLRQQQSANDRDAERAAQL